MSIRLKSRISRISHQPSQAGHCGHGKTDLRVRFNTGGSWRIFLTRPREVPRGWVRFVWQLVALTSEVRSLTTPTRRNSKTRREQLPVTGGTCRRCSALCKQRSIRAELRWHLRARTIDQRVLDGRRDVGGHIPLKSSMNTTLYRSCGGSLQPGAAGTAPTASKLTLT